jgi:hypothetical protein
MQFTTPTDAELAEMATDVDSADGIPPYQVYVAVVAELESRGRRTSDVKSQKWYSKHFKSFVPADEWLGSRLTDAGAQTMYERSLAHLLKRQPVINQTVAPEADEAEETTES